ncbi:MAG: aminopeptidase [bacterium]
MAKKIKNDGNKVLKDKLFLTKKSVWDSIDSKTTKEIFDLGDEYKKFLNNCKTEREAVSHLEKWSSKEGYKNIEKATKNDRKIFINNKGVSAVIANINNLDFKKGFNIIASHIDSPQLDLKGVTLYEADDMAFMKTHYYGGIKKYHWVAIPLSMHGIVVKENGQIVTVAIGDDENDPVFTVNDLLIHLAQDQITKPANKVIEGEQLNILVGSIPYKFKSGSEAIKLSILDHLYNKYWIKEEDFVSAEIHLVPAGKARDIGFDRSLVGAHGQDDRACAFTSAKALFDMEKTNKNTLAIFFDKEEIGSIGDGAADSNLIPRIFTKLIELYGVTDPRIISESMSNSKVISADVAAGIDPEWHNVMDLMNAAKMGCGVCVHKYGGARGKSGASEAHAAFIAQIRKAFAEDKVKWQVAELGKVDMGGGGTVAMYFAYYGMDVIDCGPAILSMHSTFEVASKADIYCSYKAYKAFYRHC